MASSAAGQIGAPGKPPGKPPELESFLNRRLFHPLARRLAGALVPTGISPNMVSVAGAGVVLAAGAAYVGLPWPEAVAVGFALHLLWHVVDGADGDLARLTGRASPFGEVVDGACDYLSHALLYLVLATFLDDHIGLWAYPLGLASGLSRVAQANHAESQRRIYMWRTYGVPWLQQARATDDELFRRRGPVARLFLAGARGYIALANALSPTSAEIERAVASAATDPAARRRLTRLSRHAARRPLFFLMLLGANPRTVILGLSMALGSPLYFFLVETTVLNLLLIVSIREQKKGNRKLAELLARA
ncbi:CDP-alcohol phosphatidyltransferase family protein [Allosphingosinicella sp.]|uniref:CDP-alcohol phosphatidyltransferase family protein n=1 Tax=Allosphingosinicella sp. TaxID=2823234 RepID=UPI002F1D4F17